MLVKIDELRDHMSGVTFTAEQNKNAAIVLKGVQRALERRLNRRFEPVERTEMTFTDHAGFALLSASPVASVSTASRVDTGYPITPVVSVSGVWTGEPLTWLLITYVGGGGSLDPEDLADVKLAIAEKAAQWMNNRHSDSVEVTDLGMEPQPVATFDWKWTPDEVEPLARLRRRVIL